MGLLGTTLGLNDSARMLTPKAWAALMVIALFAILPGFFNLPTMDRDEARYAQAARQMMETGDFIDIRFQDQARHVKPAGIYWMQVVTSAPFGGPDAPQWAHRLPSLIGCLIAIGLTAWLGARVGGARVGFGAGILMALTLLMSVEGRTAKTDAMLLAAITFAQVALYALFHPPKSAQKSKFVGWPLVFWLAQGVGLMIKGPIITLVFVATILPLCLWRRDWNILKRLHIPLGLIVMFAVVMPWLVTITWQTQGGFIEQSLGHAFMGKVASGDDSHGAPPGYHTIGLLLTYWPGALLLVLSAAYGWMKRNEPLVQFLLCWIVPTWIIFEMVATKLPHYPLPVFPAIAILTSLAISEAGTVLSGRTTKIAHCLCFGLFALATSLLGIVPYYLASEMGVASPAAAMAVVVAALMIITAGGFLSFRPSHARLLPLAGATILFYVALYAATLPAFDNFWLTRGLKREAAQITGCDTVAFATLGYREPSVVFNFGTNTLLAVGQEGVDHLQENPDCGLIAVSQSELADFITTATGRNLQVRELGVVDGFNYVKGDQLTMTFYALASSKFVRRGDQTSLKLTALSQKTN